tara:strand:- start:1471 stop:2313 length:843 start_codon:yes stop_codon:yes gene_type:complete
MGIRRAPNIIQDGLVLALDPGSRRCYPGTGTDLWNLVDSSYISSWPSYGTVNNTAVRNLYSTEFRSTFNQVSDEGGGKFGVWCPNGEDDGGNKYIDLGDRPELDLTSGDFTIIQWFVLNSDWNSGNEYPNVVSKGASAGWDTDGWSLFVFRPDDGRAGFACRNGSTTNIVTYNYSTSGDDSVYGDFRMLTAVASGGGIGGNFTVYQDLEMKNNATRVINPASNSNNVLIGKGPSGDSFGDFGCALGPTYIYNRSLSTSERKQMYDAIFPRLKNSLYFAPP